RDREDGAHLAAQLARMPGAVRADVALHRATSDPLARTTTPAALSALIIVDDHADRAAIARTAGSLITGTAPEIPSPAIAVEVGAERPVLARVGPFAVSAASRSGLLATLAAMLAAI